MSEEPVVGQYLKILSLLALVFFTSAASAASNNNAPRFRRVSNQSLVASTDKQLPRKFRNAPIVCDFNSRQTRIGVTKTKRGKTLFRPLTKAELKFVKKRLGGKNNVCPRKAACRPAPQHVSIEAKENSTTSLQVPTNLCGLATSIAEISDPQHGTITSTDGEILYLPDAHFLGEDSFTYRLQNPLEPEGSLGSVTILVSTEITNFAGDSASLVPYRAHLTSAEAMGLLHRVGLGGNDDLRTLARSNPERSTFVEELLSWSASSAIEDRSESEGTAVGLLNNSFPEVTGGRALWESYSTRVAWSVQLLKGSGLRELALLNLHDHFAANIDAPQRSGQIGLRWSSKDHYLKLRHYSMGSMREFMHEMNYDTVMGWSLDNRSNRYYPSWGSDPAATGNFNYGREVLERFTLGKDSLYPTIDPTTGNEVYQATYTEGDVSSAALLLSGFDAWFPGYGAQPGFQNWNVAGSGVPYLGMGMHFVPQWVYPGGAVSIFSTLGNHPAHQTMRVEEDALRPGRSLSADNLVDLLFFDHPGTAENLAYRFFGRYAYPSPPREITEQLAVHLKATDFDMTELLRVILNSSAMFSPESQNGCIKTPAEHLALVARMSRLPLNSTAAFRRMNFALVQSGHAVFEPGDVFGFRQCGDRISAGVANHGETWLNSQSLVNRGRELWRLLENQTDPNPRTEIFEGNSNLYVTGEGANLAELLLTNSLEADPALVVEQAAQALDITLSDAERNVLVNYIHRPSLNFPWDPTNQERTRQLMRGLVWILGMHPRSMT